MRDAPATTNRETPVVDRHSRTATQTVASPFRLANGSAFGFLAEEDGYIFGKGRKRTKFGRPSSEWVFVDAPPSPVEKATDWETDDIEARLQEFESAEPAGLIDAEPPSPSPQTVHTDSGISNDTNDTEAVIPAEFLEDTVSPSKGEDVEVLHAADTYKEDGVGSVEGRILEHQKEGKALEIQKAQFEEVGQNQAEKWPLVSEVHRFGKHEETDGEHVEGQRENELQGQSPSPAPVFSHERMKVEEAMGKGHELKSPPEEEELCNSSRPDFREDVHQSPFPVLRTTSSPSSYVETTAPAQYNPFLAKSEAGGSEETELGQQSLPEGQMASVVDLPDVHFTFQGNRTRQASVSAVNSAMEEERECSVKSKLVTDGVSSPPEHFDIADAQEGSVSGEDSDIEMVSEMEGPKDERFGYDVRDRHVSGASSGYDSEPGKVEEVEYGSEEYGSERGQNAHFESRADTEEGSFWDDSESDMEEDGGNQQPMRRKPTQAEVIVIYSDDESDDNSEPEDNQRPGPDLEQLPKADVSSPDQREDAYLSQDCESEISDVEGRSGQGSRFASSQDSDTGIQEHGAVKNYTWLDGAPDDAQQSQLPGQSFLAAMECQGQGPVPKALPEQEAQGPFEPISQPVVYDFTAISEARVHLPLTETSDTTAHNKTTQFEYRETLHAETQMATPADTQEAVGSPSHAHTLPIVSSHDLLSPQMSQELQATVENTAEVIKSEPRTEGEEIFNETEPSPVYLEDTEVDAAPKARDRSQEPLVPMASGVLLETVEEEPPIQDFVDALSTVERSPESPTPSFESAREYSSDIEPQSGPVSQVTSPAVGRRTRLAYFCPLSSLSRNFNSAVDTLSVVVSSSPVSQATHQPRDHYVTLHVTDPSTEGITVCAQAFCNDEDALPVASKGDVILLRNFKVSSADRKAVLCSTGKISSWAVFIQGDENNVWIAGPPVEYDDDERAYVSELRQWYLEEGAELLEKKEALLSNRGSTEASMTGTSDAGSTASTRGGKKRSRRREKKSTPRRLTVHELRHGRRYTDASPSDKESIHELRNGTLYAHL